MPAKEIQFIDEHDSFFKKWREMVLQYGFPNRGPAPEGIEKWLADCEKLNANAKHYALDYGNLLNRWALNGLRAPYLPEPMQMQNPVLIPNQAPHLTRGGGKLIYVPDILPVPDRDTAREMLAGSDAPGTFSHLEEWHVIVDAKNNGKTSILRFDRVFRLQHYWRVMHGIGG